MRVASITRLGLAILLLLPLSLAQAEVYKCTQADGNLLYSDSPCSGSATGSRMSQQELDSHTSNLGKLAPTADAKIHDSRSSKVVDQASAQLSQVSARVSHQLEGRLPDAALQRLRQVPGFYWIGLIISFVGTIGLLIAAFRASIWWGLACLLIPLAQLVFLAMRWAEARNPFLLQLLGVAIMVAALLYG